MKTLIKLTDHELIEMIEVNAYCYRTTSQPSVRTEMNRQTDLLLDGLDSTQRIFYQELYRQAKLGIKEGSVRV